MAFKKPPLGKRGYDEEDVDAFLDEVEQELVRLLEENASLRDEAQRVGAGGPGPASSVTIRSELAGLTAQLEWMQAARARAEEHARSIATQLEQTRNAGAGGSGGGRMAQVVIMAQRTADEYLRDAEGTSEQLLEESRAEAEQISGEARLRAETMERDARRDHTESINRVATERAALLDEIARLSQLAQGYEAALRSHVTRQLQELGTPIPLD